MRSTVNDGIASMRIFASASRKVYLGKDGLPCGGMGKRRDSGQRGASSVFISGPSTTKMGPPCVTSHKRGGQVPKRLVTDARIFLTDEGARGCPPAEAQMQGSR